MKPDKPGEWHSRDGRRIYMDGDLVWMVVGGSCWFGYDELLGDDWLPAVAPTFPELPPKPKPLLCLVRVKARHGQNSPEWALWENGTWFVTNYHFYSRELEVVYHPGNDPEAVELIEESQDARK